MKTNDKNSVGYSKSIPNNLDSGAPIQDTIWKVVKRWKSQFIVSGAVVVLAILTFLEHRLDLPHLFTGTPPSPFDWAQVTFDLVTIVLVGFASVFMLSVIQSKHKSAEEALQRSENKYRTLVENLPQKIFLKDKNSVYLSCNENYARDLKIEPEEITGKTDYDFFPKELAEKYRADDKRVMESSETEDIEESYIQEGEELFVHTVKTPVKDEQGNLIGLLGIFWDITERKRGEGALKRERDFSQSILETANSMIVCLDGDAKITVFNQECERVTDYRREEVLGKAWPELFLPPDQRHAELKSFAKWVRAHPRDQYEGPIVTKTGEIRTILWSNTAILGSDEEEVVAIAIGYDITERKRAEEQIAYQAQLLAIVNDAVVASDAQYRLTAWNAAAESMYGWKAEEVLGRFGLDITRTEFPGVDNADILRAIAERGSWRGEATQARKEGTRFPVEVSSVVLRDTTGKVTGFVSVNRDITERKRGEEQILRQSALLKAINKVFQETLTCKTNEEVARTCLAVAEKLTGSKFGWIGELNPDGCLDAIAISDPGWDACLMPESDAVVMLKNMEIHGIWGKVLKEEKSLMVNDPASHPDRVGIPKGHPPLASFLGVPLKRAGKTFGMIALANKELGYDLADQQAVETLSVAFMEALDRKKAEEALKESEEKYKALIEAAGRAGVGIIIIQDSGEGEAVFVFVNDQFCMMSDHSREELIGKSPWDLIPPEISTRLRDWYKRRHMGESLPTHYEAAGVRKDGTVVPLELSIVTMPWQGKIATVLYLRDVTERKKAEETLRESEERFRQLAENIDQVFWLTDWENNKLLYVNPSYEKLFDRSCQSAYEDRLSWYKVMHPDDRARVRESLVKNAKLGQNTEVEYRIVRDDGTMRWILDRNYPIYDKHGKVYRIVSIAEDITERKRVEEALRESEEKYRELAESITDIFFAMDKDLRYTYWNKASENLTGIAAKDVLGKSLYDIFPDTPQTRKAEQAYLNVLRTKEPQTFVSEYHLGGKDIVFEITAYPSKDGLSVFTKDITERNKAEEILKKERQRLFSVLDIMPTFVYLQAPDHSVRFTNRKFRELFGDPGSRPCYEAFYGRKEPCDPCITLRVLKTRAPQTWEWTSQNGRTYMIYEDIFPAEDDEDLVLEIGTDITERKRAEEVLRESEYNYRSLMEQASDGIFMSYGQGNYIDVNRAACEMLGYTHDELLHLSTSRIVHPEDLAAQPLRWDELRTGEAILIERRLIRKDGTTIPVEITARMLEDGRFQALVRDITERKRAEEALKESEEKYRTLFETMLQGVVYQDRTGRITSANPAAEAILGLTFEQMLGRTSSDPRWKAIHEDGSDFPGETHPSMVALKTGKPVRNEMMGVFHPQESRYHWIIINAIPQFKPGEDTPYQAYTTFSDITERKRAEEVLRQTRDYLESLFNYANAPIICWDAKFEITRFNHAFEYLTNYKAEEVIGKDLSILFPRESKEESLSKIRRTLSGEHWEVVEIPILRKGGDIRIVLWNSANVYAEDGKILLATIAQGLDITERKRAEEEIHKLNQYLGSIIDNANIWLDVLDEKTQVVIWNKAAEQISGFSREEVVGHGKIWEWLYPEERYRKEITTKTAAIIEKGEMVEDFETTIRCKDGEIKTISWHSRDILGADGKPIGSIALGRDVTERKKMEAQLIQSERLTAVGTLAYGIAHEFNNILAGILGNAEFGMGNDDPQEMKECFQIIMESCDRAKSITNSLLAFSRQRETKKQRADITEAVETVLGLVERELEKQNIKTVRKFSPIPEITCDLGELSGVVLNMITNARDAMRPKGGTLTIEIEKKRDNIEIIFTDSGCGIPNSIKGRIFEPFVTTKGALGQSEIPGMGLGLFLSYGIISRYHGEIKVKSEMGKGSKFTIKIPIYKNQTETVLVETEEKQPAAVPQNLNILLVDDEKPICTAIKKFFEAKGHSVTCALSGKKGLAAFKKGSFDLVLADIIMPDMDGVELISKLKKIDKQVKFIVLTGHIADEKLEKAKKAGADQIMMKPFRNEELYQAIGKVLSV